MKTLLEIIDTTNELNILQTMKIPKQDKYEKPLGNKQGGKRSNAGRKPVTDRKKGITIYLHQSEIDANGGIEEVKSVSVLYLKKRGQIKEKI